MTKKPLTASLVMVLAASLTAGCQGQQEPRPFRVVVAATGTLNEPAYQDLAPLTQALTAVDSHRDLSVSIVTGDGVKSSEMDATALRSQRNKERTREYEPDRRESMLGAWGKGTFIPALAARRWAAETSDLLAAWNTAIEDRPDLVIVLTSGIDTMDPLDMRVTGLPNTDSDARTIADGLLSRKAIARASGTRVEFAGVGAVHAPQTTPPHAYLEGLRLLMKTMCQDAGGVGCEVLPEAPGGSTESASPLTAPVVDFPPPQTQCSKDGSATSHLPDSYLGFALGRADLGPHADDVLMPFASALRGDGSVRAVVAGFTSPEGPVQLNANLRIARAQAVKDRLVRLEAPASRIKALDGRAPRGTIAPDAYPSLRRVDITLKFPSLDRCRAAGLTVAG